MFVVVGLKNADNVWGLFGDAMPAIASVSLLIGLLESAFCICGVRQTIGKVLSGEICVAMFCGKVNWCGSVLFRKGIRPVGNSGTKLCEAFCPVTKWWACSRRSQVGPNAGKSPTSKFSTLKFSSFLSWLTSKPNRLEGRHEKAVFFIPTETHPITVLD